MEKEQNLKLFNVLYDIFINYAYVTEEQMERFIDSISPTFMKNNSDIKILLGPMYDNDDEEDVSSVKNELDVVNRCISTNLVLSLIDFLFNLSSNMRLIYCTSDELDDKVKVFNDIAEDIESRIRIITYRGRYQGILIALPKIE